MKVHLSLATRDLASSVAFCRTLLVAEPAKRHDDYALFLTDDPDLELALDLDPSAPVGADAHYGLTVDTPDAIDAAIVRLQAAGFAVDVERDATCCYAVQTKVWAADPDGRRWEVYTVLAETASRGDDGPGCCVGSETRDDDSSGCCAVGDAGASELTHVD